MKKFVLGPFSNNRLIFFKRILIVVNSEISTKFRLIDKIKVDNYISIVKSPNKYINGLASI